MDERRKFIIIDTIGQLPIMGGVTGPILKPFYLDTDSIRTLLAFRVSVKEVFLDVDEKPIVRKGKYVSIPLDFNNYDKMNQIPESKKKSYYNNEKKSQYNNTNTNPTFSKGKQDQKSKEPFKETKVEENVSKKEEPKK